MRRLTIMLWAALAGAAASTSDALAAASIAVQVTPPVPGSAAAPLPVAVAIGVSVSPSAPGALPPMLRTLAISTPDGFGTTLAGATACTRDALEQGGPQGCPPDSKLGSGSAEFIYVAGALRIRASTRELTIVRGDGDAILVHAAVTQPAPFSIVLPGALTARPAPAGPLLTLDLGSLARIDGGGRAVVTRATFDLERGLASGPCPTGAWAFGAQLEYAGGGSEQRVAEASCSRSSDVTPPRLRASARNGAAALGARFAIALSEPASVRVTLERRAGGRWLLERRATRAAPAGASVLHLRRARGRALPRGRYRARIRAADAAGLTSRKRTVAFRLR